MASLTLSLLFPTGQFHAHDARGNAEWPPAPARVLTALLATAYATGSHGGVAVTRRLFELPPPTLHTPPTAERHVAFSRWVPVDVYVNPATGHAERAGNLAKPPERGTTLDADRAVTMTWDHSQLTSSELERLDEVLADVTYLGRPTSPVMVRRLTVSSTPSPDPTATVWIPDDTGTHRLRVGTTQLLAALDAREQQREELDITGHHPRLAARPEVRYRRVEPAVGSGTVYRPATHAVTADAATGLAYLRTPHAAPGDVTALVHALHPDSGDAFVLPVYGATTRRGLTTHRLLGIATHGIAPQAVTYVRARELVDLPPPRPGVTGVTALRAVADAWATATAWTTLMPVTADHDTLIDQVKKLAARHNTDVIDAATHDVGRHLNGPDTTLHPNLTHLSLLFSQPIHGPLRLQGAALTPIPQTDAE